MKIIMGALLGAGGVFFLIDPAAQRALLGRLHKIAGTVQQEATAAAPVAGTEALLPRGTLREPPKNLRRASYVLLTKCTGVSNEKLVARIRRYNRTAEIIECRHGPIHLENVFTRERQPLGLLHDKWVGAISAIAVPEASATAAANSGPDSRPS